MARSRRKSVKPVGPLQALHDRTVAEENTRPVLSPFAEQHGDYETHLGRTVNRGGTALERWRRADPPLLSETQIAAIIFCQKLWARLGSPSKGLVADYLKLPRGVEDIGTDAFDAQRWLDRVSEGFPPAYWAVFENVCRFDEPAGQIGSRLLDRPAATAADAARLCVCMVADMIAMRERL